VDNACKYAATAEDRTIRLDAAREGGQVLLRISDYGPGIRCDRRKLFRPFSKSARDAAHTAPGLGLGLALSRRLARRMRGDLALDGSRPSGTRFVLSIPIA
jgi:signal transduction histidine kinase